MIIYDPDIIANDHWGDPQHDRFDEIFQLAKANGFTGLEIGFRRLSAVSVARMLAMLERHGLVINASHIGGNLGECISGS